MMNLTSNQGNANSANNEIAFFTNQIGKNVKDGEYPVLATLWGEGTSYAVY